MTFYLNYIDSYLCQKNLLQSIVTYDLLSKLYRLLLMSKKLYFNLLEHMTFYLNYTYSYLRQKNLLQSIVTHDLLSKLYRLLLMSKNFTSICWDT